VASNLARVTDGSNFVRGLRGMRPGADWSAEVAKPAARRSPCGLLDAGLRGATNALSELSRALDLERSPFPERGSRPELSGLIGVRRLLFSLKRPERTPKPFPARRLQIGWRRLSVRWLRAPSCTRKRNR
jgi:hypothetical protein